MRKESYKHKSAREKKVVKCSKTKKTFATITFAHIYNVAERRGENHLIDCYHFWQTSACVLLETMNSERHSNFFYTKKKQSKFKLTTLSFAGCGYISFNLSTIVL